MNMYIDMNMYADGVEYDCMKMLWDTCDTLGLCDTCAVRYIEDVQCDTSDMCSAIHVRPSVAQDHLTCATAS